MHRQRRWLAFLAGLVLLAAGGAPAADPFADPGGEAGPSRAPSARGRVAHAEAPAGDGWQLRLLAPLPGAVQGSPELAVAWSVLDAVYGGEPASARVRVTLAGQALAADGQPDPPPWVREAEGFSLRVALPGEGALRVAIDLLEADGRPASGHDEADLWVDTSAPVLFWTEPPEEALLPGPDLPLSGLLTDPRLAGASLELAPASGPARSLAPDLVPLATLQDFRLQGSTGPLEEGPWTATLRAWDDAEPAHEAALTRRWLVDGTPPELAWTAGGPLEGVAPELLEELPAGGGAPAYRRLRYEAAWSLPPGAPAVLEGAVSDAWSGFTLLRRTEAGEEALATALAPATVAVAGPSSASFRLDLGPGGGGVSAPGEAGPPERELRALLLALDGAGNLLEAELLLHVQPASAGTQPAEAPAPPALPPPRPTPCAPPAGPAGACAPGRARTLGDWATPLGGRVGRAEAAPFRDVPEEGELAEAVRFLWREGILRGLTPERVAPEAPLERAQAAAWLVRALGGDALPQPEPWWGRARAAAEGTGLWRIGPGTAGSGRARESLARAEWRALLERAARLAGEAAGAVPQAAVSARGDGGMTRGEALLDLWRWRSTACPPAPAAAPAGA